MLALATAWAKIVPGASGTITSARTHFANIEFLTESIPLLLACRHSGSSQRNSRRTEPDVHPALRRLESTPWRGTKLRKKAKSSIGLKSTILTEKPIPLRLPSQGKWQGLEVEGT